MRAPSLTSRSIRKFISVCLSNPLLLFFFFFSFTFSSTKLIKVNVLNKLVSTFETMSRVKKFLNNINRRCPFKIYQLLHGRLLIRQRFKIVFRKLEAISSNRNLKYRRIFDAEIFQTFSNLTTTKL